jgi:hypothetical protein
MAVHVGPPDQESRNPGELPEESRYSPTATHRDGDGHATDWICVFCAGAAPAGRGAVIAVHDVPDPVSTKPSCVLEEVV